MLTPNIVKGFPAASLLSAIAALPSKQRTSLHNNATAKAQHKFRHDVSMPCEDSHHVVRVLLGRDAKEIIDKPKDGYV